MPLTSYRQAGLTLSRGGAGGTKQQVRDLQRDLRRLGYLRSGIDGNFGSGTETAVKALQCDLLLNDGRSTQGDGPAPIAVLDYNRGRVGVVNGRLDNALAACMADMLDDPLFPDLPMAANPASENRKFIEGLKSTALGTAPMPFLLAIFKQESGLKHFVEPGAGDEDTFIVLGLDTNSSRKDRVTSRGYGVGQYTLFHHPATSAEVKDFMLDPARNVEKATGELREKFDRFVTGNSSGTQASDRIAEQGSTALRVCKYAKGDSRYLNDCRQCAHDAGLIQIKAGDAVFKGSSLTYQPTRNYKSASYTGVPSRARIGCDWPYAVRRYNGAGVDSYHYQARVLRNLAVLVT